MSSFVNAYEAYNTPEDMLNYLATHFTIENVSAELSNPEMLFLVATQNDNLVGYTKLLFKTEYEVKATRPLEIARLYTRVDLIGGGIGKKLVAEAATYGKANGFDAICLGVWQRNPGAVRFYQREGFEIAGTTTFVLGTDVQDDYIMIHKLK